MLSFNKLLSSVLIAIALSSSVTLAAPWPASSKFSTHRKRVISRDAELDTFHPHSDYQTFGDGIDHPTQSFGAPSLKDSTVSFVSSRLGVDPSTILYVSGSSGDTTKNGYVKQTHDGVPFANAVANVALNQNDKIVAFGNSFVKPSTIPASQPTVSFEDAQATAEAALGAKYNNHPHTLEYLALEDGTAALTHVLQVQDSSKGIWKEAFVDAHTNKLLSVTDFVAKASYLALPIQKATPDDGFQTLTNPQNPDSSPNGWHTVGGTTSTTTSGNNAISFKTAATGVLQVPSTQSSAQDNFIYAQDQSQDPDVGHNVDAARVNTFYLVNTVHDIAYQYGFTESAFNFQNDNFGKGGLGNDRVTISVQDAAGTDNADFSTPPDGQSGAMRMFIFDLTNPERDGALENAVVVHEATHGISNRLTGGGTGRCLQTTEAGGMGEGWSDAFAEWTQQKSASVQDFVLGQYVTNNPKGIRTHPYSTNAKTNPLRYSSVATLNEVHNIGEVWANMLHNLYAALVSAHGFSSTAKTDSSGTKGNVVYLHLFIDGLAGQPCNPTFVSARDAILQADQNRYQGANKCIIWKAFASRGLGSGAVAGKYVDSTSVPSGC